MWHDVPLGGHRSEISCNRMAMQDSFFTTKHSGGCCCRGIRCVRKIDDVVYIELGSPEIVWPFISGSSMR